MKWPIEENDPLIVHLELKIMRRGIRRESIFNQNALLTAEFTKHFVLFLLPFVQMSGMYIQSLYQ